MERECRAGRWKSALPRRTQEAIRDTSLSACRAALSVFRWEAPPYLANPGVLPRPGLRLKLERRYLP